MKIHVLIYFLSLFSYPILSLAEDIQFGCSLLKFSNESGLKTYSKVYSFDILWNKEKNIALYIKNKIQRKMKVVDSIDMVSFIDIGFEGSVKTVSIQKQNGSATYSINQFGLSHQAYGNCKFKN